MRHAKLSPSGSSRWLSCTASVKVCEQYERTTNAQADWGTEVHDISERMLKGQSWKCSDPEKVTCAEQYVQYCKELITKNSEQFIETEYTLEFIQLGMFGTGDFATFDKDTNHLDIVDLKTGHNLIGAEENTQLMLYALGCINELDVFGYYPKTVTLHIVQTRAGHMDSWTTNMKRLNDFRHFATEQAVKIETGKTSFNPNDKACKWCPHQGECVALKEHVENIVKGDFEDLDSIDGHADKLSNNAIKKILDNADLIESFVGAVKQIALERLNAGEDINGYKLVESKTNRKWSDEESVEAYLKERGDGIDYYQAPKLKPMTHILKILKDDEKINEFVVKPEGKPTLAKIDDKRTSLKSVADEFDII